MYTQIENEVERLTDQPLLECLGHAGIGVFTIDADGSIRQFNDTAAEIFGIDDNTPWDDLSITRIDTFLSTGLGDKFPDLMASGEPFVGTAIGCTNPNGRFMVLNMSCQPRTDGVGGMIGVVEEVNTSGRRTEQVPSLIRELELLTEVSAALSSSFELDRVLKVILTAATASQGLGFNRVFLFLLDSENQKLNGHLAIGPSDAEDAGQIWSGLESKRQTLRDLLSSYEDSSRQHDEPITELIRHIGLDLSVESLVKGVCESGRWANLENETPLDDPTAALLDALGTRCMALVPLISKGKLIGLLAADNLITRVPISNDSVQLLQLLANQAAVAMEKARLYDEQKKRARELMRMNSLLKESQDQIIKIEKMSIIGELTSAVAHELRNPLTIIGGFANLMLKSELSVDLRDYLGIIASEVRRTEEVLEHVLDFHRSSQHESETLNLSDLVEKNLKLCLGRMHQSDAQISLSLASEKLMVYGIKDQLAHAAYQLFRLVAGELIPSGSAEVRTERRENNAAVIVSFECDDRARLQLTRALRQVFTDNKASQRLTIMVAGETIKYHGGNLGVAAGADGAPSIYFELPLCEEG